MPDVIVQVGLPTILKTGFIVFSKRTGEEITDENFKRNAYFHQEKGCKTYYKIDKQVNKDGAVCNYLVILLCDTVGIILT